MTPDTAALRALADAATPGPWEAVWNDDLGEYTVYSHADDGFEEVCTITPDVPPEAHYIAALDPDTVRALCDTADEVERLRTVLARWESGQRVKALPVLPEHPDALNLAAELLRKQTGEYEDTDAAMRAAATALRDVDQIARQSRTAHAALVADLRSPEALERVARAIYDVEDNGITWDAYVADGESTVFRDYAAAALAALLDRHAPEEGS